MKTYRCVSSLLILAAALSAAQAGPKDDLTSAVKTLADKPNYSWKTTVVVPAGSRFRPGPTEGKTEKDGLTHVTMSIGDNQAQAVLKGEKVAVNTTEGGWQTLAELNSGEGPARFLGFMVRNIKTPTVQAGDLTGAAKEITKEGDVYSSDLTADGAKALLAFRPPRDGGEAPSVNDAKGSVKFWLKDGALSKYEFKVSGKVSFGGSEREVDRTTTVEIKDVGTTKVEVPDEAKKKIS